MYSTSTHQGLSLSRGEEVQGGAELHQHWSNSRRVGAHTMPLVTAKDVAAYLCTPQAIRERCGRVYELAKQGKLHYFDYHPEKEKDVVEFCLGIIKVRRLRSRSFMSFNHILHLSVISVKTTYRYVTYNEGLREKVNDCPSADPTPWTLASSRRGPTARIRAVREMGLDRATIVARHAERTLQTHGRPALHLCLARCGCGQHVDLSRSAIGNDVQAIGRAGGGVREDV
jgi:hypothetical protein